MRNRVTVTYFFRMAYVWKFKKDADVHKDVEDYMGGADPPPYVQDYVRDIQQKERHDALPSLQGTN